MLTYSNSYNEDYQYNNYSKYLPNCSVFWGALQFQGVSLKLTTYRPDFYQIIHKLCDFTGKFCPFAGSY